MAEPAIQVSENEAVAIYSFDDPTGYTYDPSYVEFSGGKLKLVDLGGGTYQSGAHIVEFPAVSPTVVTQWLRSSWIYDISQGSGVFLEFQASNDGGDNWGTNSPEYNDREWRSYDRDALQAIETNQKGSDWIKFRVILFSDGTNTPEIDDLQVSLFLYSRFPIPEAYSPKFTSKVIISDVVGGTVKVSEISDGALRYGEDTIIIKLYEYGIDYEDLINDPARGAKFAKMLEMAATYQTLCITGQYGIGAGVAGPVKSISYDGMSKDYASVVGTLRGSEASPLDYCEQSFNMINGVIKMFQAEEGSAINGPMPGISRDNELLDEAFHQSGRDIRRRYFSDDEDLWF